ncbi:hypothetical protein A2U01_0003157, partial [Trifolium medium]|nr:hypothetical protein [Trifolium medium]
MEDQANKKRKECTFAPGDLVLLRLQPYRQSTVQRRVSQKLSKRFFGPFPVLRRIGAVAYELELPPSTRIHPVIHVSQLRAYHGDNPQAHFTPIPDDMRGRNFLEEDGEGDTLIECSKKVLESTLEGREKYIGNSTFETEQHFPKGIGSYAV